MHTSHGNVFPLHSVLLLIAGVALAPTAVHAQTVTLRIGYELPENPDLAASARDRVSAARDQRNVVLAACSTGRDDPTVCRRDTEISFRGRLAATPGLRFTLWSTRPDGACCSWLFDLTAAEAVDPDLDQWFLALQPGRLFELGVQVDPNGCVITRTTDQATVRRSDAFSRVLCDLVANVLRPYEPDRATGPKDARHMLRVMLREARLNTELYNRDRNGAVMSIVRGDHNVSKPIVVFLLDHGGARTSDDQERALSHAAAYEHPWLLTLLLERQFDVNSINCPIVRPVRRPQPPAMRPRCGITPIFSTIGNRRVHNAELLINQGADVNAADDEGYTPLMSAARGGFVQGARLFLAHGADPNARSDFGETPLSEALAGGHREIVTLLRARGAR